MAIFISIINFCASLISIIGFLLSIRQKDQTRNIILYLLIIILSIITAISCTQYKRVVDERLNIEKRKEELTSEACNILKSSPTYISYYSAGENEGILYSTLRLLEMNKDLCPEMYEAYKINVMQKIEKANEENDFSKKRELLQLAGESALQILKAIAK